MPTDAHFVVRLGHAEDRPFLFSSWLKSFRDSCPYVWNGTYYAGQHRLIESLLADEDTAVHIAAPMGDDLTIYGWVVHSRDAKTLHYVYVKEAFRRMGIGAVLARNPQVTTHMTKYGQLALKGRPVAYNPYLLMRGTADG